MKSWLDAWLPGRLRACGETRRAVVGVGALWVLVMVLVFLKREEWPEAAARFAARGNSLRVELVALGWIWKALLVNAVVLAALLVTPRWWAVPKLRVVESPNGEQGGGRNGLRVAVVGLVVLVVALSVRLPRMDLSLYNDEAHNYARLWSGTWQEKEGNVILRSPRWGETWFLNQAGNNSQPYSILTRSCLDLGERLGWRVTGQVSEGLARWPSLVAGLLAIGLLGGTLSRSLGSKAGGMAMLAMALHPWHARYSTEARGYALMILGITVMLWFAGRAMESGRWRDWLGYGAGLLLTAASFLGSIYFLACFSAVLLGRQVIEWRRQGDASLVWRPLVSSLLAAMAGLVTLLPLMPQLMEVLDQHESIRGSMGAAWWKDVASYLVAGIRWADVNPESPVNLAMSRWADSPLGALALAAWLAVFVAGFCGGLRRGGVVGLLLMATPLAAALSWCLMTMRGGYLNHWYLIYAVPAVGAAFGVGVVALVKRQWLLGGCVALTAVAVPASQAWAWRLLPKQQERAPVEAVFGAVYPGAAHITRDAGPMMAAFWCNTTLYHPAVVEVKKPENLRAMVDRARREGRELHVCFSHRGPALKHDPELVHEVEQSGAFERAGVFRGQEGSQFDMHWYRMKAQAGADAAPGFEPQKSAPR